MLVCGRNKHQEVCLWTRVEGIFSIRLELPGGVWCYVLSGQSGQSCNIVCTCYVCGRPWDVMIPAQPIVCLCGTELRSFFDPAASEGPNIPRHTGAASLLGTSVLDTPPLSLGPGSDQPPPASPPPSNASASASGWSFAQADSFQEWARDHPQTAAANPWLEAVYQTNNADNAEDEGAIDVTAEVPEDCQAEVDEAREITVCTMRRLSSGRKTMPESFHMLTPRPRLSLSLTQTPINGRRPRLLGNHCSFLRSWSRSILSKSL